MQRKLVQFVDGLGNALVLAAGGGGGSGGVGNGGYKLMWTRVSGSPSESMWVMEVHTSGKYMKCMNQRFPSMCLDSAGAELRAVNTVNEPQPLPLSLREHNNRHMAGLNEFIGPGNQVLVLKGETESRGFKIITLANQHTDGGGGGMGGKTHMSGWSMFGIFIMCVSIILVISGVIFLNKRPGVLMQMIVDESKTNSGVMRQATAPTTVAATVLPSLSSEPTAYEIFGG